MASLRVFLSCEPSSFANRAFSSISLSRFTSCMISFSIDDFSSSVGGQTRISECGFLLIGHGIVFVVDSNDRERVIEARDTLHRFRNKDEAKEIPLLVIANKQDLPGAMSVYEIMEKLDLHSLSVHCCMDLEQHACSAYLCCIW